MESGGITANDHGEDSSRRGSEDGSDERSNYSSSDESYRSESCSESSSDGDSYESSDSDDDSRSSNTDDSYESDGSHDDDSSRDSLRLNDSSHEHDAVHHRSSPVDQSAQGLISSALPSNVQTNISTTNRTVVRRGVLPIVVQGADQNCDPNSTSTLIHRRGRSAKEGQLLQDRNQPQCRSSDEWDDDKAKGRGFSRRHRRKVKSSRHNKQKNKSGFINCCIKYLCCQTQKRSTQILVLSVLVWILAQCYYFYYWNLKDFFIDNVGEMYHEFFGVGGHHRLGGGRGMGTKEAKQRVHHHDYYNQHLYQKHSDEELDNLREQRMREAEAALGNAADFDYNGYRRDSGGKPLKLNNRRSKGGRKGSRDSEGASRTERLSDGCSPLDWHSYHFPNCNEVHEIDLQTIVKSRRNRRRGSRSSSRSTTTPWGFVGNGLWRDVFTCDPHDEANYTGSAPPLPPAVLKIMKSEHPYNQRNFQRHRRDALVMERLSGSHHLVAIYGYCSNTVLTQAISHTLDDVIYAEENEKVKTWSPNGGYKAKPPLESWMGRDESGDLLATRGTELGRIKLALGVFRGLMDLHEGDGTTKTEWLPIVHADLQSKQYLVDSQTGQVYLNDFNRCRFIAKNDRAVNSTGREGSNSNSTLESCPLYIPTAPGSARAPEEYNMSPLSEKLDIYSAGNILYGIITGNRPWDNERGKHVKAGIQKGKRPPVNETIRNAEGTVDAELTRLLDRVYEGDPRKRASAREIVHDLERLLERELKKMDTQQHSEKSDLEIPNEQDAEGRTLKSKHKLRRRL